MLQAADKYQSIVKQQYDIIQDRFNDGMISRTDLLMISTRLKEAELQYIKARQNYTLALQKLNILMGEEPNNPVDSLYTIDTASAPVQILSLENVLQRLIVSYENIGFKRGRSVMIKLLQYLTDNLKLVVKQDKLFYYDMTPAEARLFDEE